IDRRALHLRAGSGVTLTSQDRPGQQETLVTISAESGIEVPEASNDPPQPIGGAASAGTSDAYARADHAHTGPTTYPRNLWVNNQLTNGPPNDMVQIGENALLGRVGNGPIQSISPGPYAILGQIGASTPLQAITLPPNSLLIRGSGEDT